MKIYDMEFKDELKVTKVEAKQVYYSNIFKEVLGLQNKICIFNIKDSFEFSDGYKYIGFTFKLYKNYKWVLTNKLKQGDIVKHIDYKIDSNLYVFDSLDKTYNMSNCWYIYKNRPKSWLGDKWMYKLVERE